MGEIGQMTGYSMKHVSDIIASEQAQEILADLTAKRLDTMGHIELVAQAIAPQIMNEKIRLALQGNDERVRNSACSDILNIAGHQPIKRVQVERVESVDEKYKDLTDEQIREKALAAITHRSPPPSKDDEPTLH